MSFFLSILLEDTFFKSFLPIIFFISFSLKPNPGDEILVPSITFIASVNSIKYNNCNPVFMDADEDYLIDLDKTFKFLEKNTFKKNGYSINKKTKKRILGIIIVHTFGNSVNLTKKRISMFKRYNIKIIEDAAESLGSYHKENKISKHLFKILYSK